MKNQSIHSIALLLVLVAAATRLIPHPYNFTACGALALFAGSAFSDKRLAYLIPLSALFLSDLLLGLHPTLMPVYACFAFSVWLGTRFTPVSSWLKIGGASLVGSIVFFLVTNHPIWYSGSYSLDLSGVLTSYTAGLPFFRNQVLGDLFYSLALFGALRYLISRKPVAAR